MHEMRGGPMDGDSTCLEEQVIEVLPRAVESFPMWIDLSHGTLPCGTYLHRYVLEEGVYWHRGPVPKKKKKEPVSG